MIATYEPDTVEPDTVRPHYSLSLHEPFLERAAADNQDTGRSGLGAFLTLRLVDQFAADKLDLRSDAIGYQITATRDFLSDLYPQTVEVVNLQELVRVAAAAHEANDRRLLFSPLLAFAFWLEEELRLDEALDVLATTMQLSDRRDADEEVASHLQRARVLRLSGQFDTAREEYALAGTIAAHLGDTHSELLSRIGRGIVLQKVGNLPESERILREVVTQARRQRDRDAEARACHDLANTLHFAGRIKVAVPFAFRAFELYEHPMHRVRALSDTGLLLKELGHYPGAKRAFSAVLAANPTPEVYTRTALELLELSALINDRVSFERWRRDLTDRRTELLPEEQLDFEMKLGAGWTAFGHQAQSEKHLERAVALAERYKMGERAFQAEALLKAVQERRAPAVETAALHTDGIVPEPELQTTLESLRALAPAE